MKKINLGMLLAILGAIAIAIGAIIDKDVVLLDGMIVSCTAIIICYLEDIKLKLGE